MNDSKTIIELVFKLADEKKMTMTELAKRVGVAKSSLSRYKSGERGFPVNDIGTYAKVLNVPVEYLLGLDNLGSVTQEYTYIPTAISAGLPINVEGITEYEKISLPDSVMGKWAGNQDVYILKINGDSMNNIMPDNSLIAVKPITLDGLKNGDIVLFSTNHEYSVKRFYRFDDVVSFRPDSDNLEFGETRININEIDNLEIHGKVVLYIVELD